MTTGGSWLESFGRDGLPAWADRTTVAIQAGEQRPFVEAEWRDALVIIASGELELECDRGGRRRFATDSILWLTGLDVVTMHSVGDDELQLVAISRRRQAGGMASGL